MCVLQIGSALAEASKSFEETLEIMKTVSSSLGKLTIIIRISLYIKCTMSEKET